LERVPDHILQKAVSKANDAMTEAGTRNLQIMASIADDGTVTFTQPLNVQQLDQLKQALNKVAFGEVDRFGRPNDVGQMAGRLSRDLRAALGDAVPEYNAATRLGGDKIAEDNALALGRAALEKKTTLEDVVAAMDGATDAEKTAFKQGLREAIEDGMMNVRAVASDPNIDARQVRDAVFKLSPEAVRNKLEAAIGPESAKKILDLVAEEMPQLQTRAAVARGSATAVRTAGREAIEEELTPGVLGSVMRGNPVNAGRRVTQILTDTTPQADNARKMALMTEIAEVLTDVKGPEASNAMAIIQRAMEGQPVSDAQAAAIARALTTIGVLSGHQSTRRMLESN